MVTFCVSEEEGCGSGNCERRKRKIWSERESGSERKSGMMRSERRSLKWNPTVSDELGQVSPLSEREGEKETLDKP